MSSVGISAIDITIFVLWLDLEIIHASDSRTGIHTVPSTLYSQLNTFCGSSGIAGAEIETQANAREKAVRELYSSVVIMLVKIHHDCRDKAMQKNVHAK